MVKKVLDQVLKGLGYNVIEENGVFFLEKGSVKYPVQVCNIWGSHITLDSFVFDYAFMIRFNGNELTINKVYGDNGDDCWIIKTYKAASNKSIEVFGRFLEVKSLHDFYSLRIRVNDKTEILFTKDEITCSGTYNSPVKFIYYDSVPVTIDMQNEVMSAINSFDWKTIHYFYMQFPWFEKVVGEFQKKSVNNTFAELGFNLIEDDDYISFTEGAESTPIRFSLDDYDSEIEKVTKADFDYVNVITLNGSDRTCSLKKNWGTNVVEQWVLMEYKDLQCSMESYSSSSENGYVEVKISIPGASSPIVVRKYNRAEKAIFLYDDNHYYMDSSIPFQAIGLIESVDKRIINNLSRTYPWFGEAVNSLLINNKTQALLKDFGSKEASVEQAAFSSFAYGPNVKYLTGYSAKNSKGKLICNVSLEWSRSNSPKFDLAPVIHFTTSDKTHIFLYLNGIISFKKGKLRDIISENYRQTVPSWTCEEMEEILDKALSNEDIQRIMDYYEGIFKVPYRSNISRIFSRYETIDNLNRLLNNLGIVVEWKSDSICFYSNDERRELLPVITNKGSSLGFPIQKLFFARDTSDVCEIVIGQPNTDSKVTLSFGYPAVKEKEALQPVLFGYRWENMDVKLKFGEGNPYISITTPDTQDCPYDVDLVNGSLKPIIEVFHEYYESVGIMKSRDKGEQRTLAFKDIPK